MVEKTTICSAGIDVRKKYAVNCPDDRKPSPESVEKEKEKIQELRRKYQEGRAKTNAPSAKRAVGKEDKGEFETLYPKIKEVKVNNSIVPADLDTGATITLWGYTEAQAALKQFCPKAIDTRAVVLADGSVRSINTLSSASQSRDREPEDASNHIPCGFHLAPNY